MLTQPVLPPEEYEADRCECCGGEDEAGNLLCEGCGCCNCSCNCTETDCDCEACTERRGLDNA